MSLQHILYVSSVYSTLTSSIARAQKAFDSLTGYGNGSGLAFVGLDADTLRGQIITGEQLVGNLPVWDTRRDWLRMMKKYHAKLTGTSYVPNRYTGA